MDPPVLISLRCTWQQVTLYTLPTSLYFPLRLFMICTRSPSSNESWLDILDFLTLLLISADCFGDDSLVFFVLLIGLDLLWKSRICWDRYEFLYSNSRIRFTNSDCLIARESNFLFNSSTSGSIFFVLLDINSKYFQMLESLISGSYTTLYVWNTGTHY